MKRYRLDEFKGGWICGNFIPSIIKTEEFEVGVKLHPKDSQWDFHTHTKIVEITLIVSGKMKIQDKIFEKDDIFVLEPWEIANPTFLEDTFVVVIKTPSITTDKIKLTLEKKESNV